MLSIYMYFLKKKTIFWIIKKAFLDKRRSYTRYTEIYTCLCHTTLHIVVSKYYLVADCRSSLVIYNECLFSHFYDTSKQNLFWEECLLFALRLFYWRTSRTTLYFYKQKIQSMLTYRRFENAKYFSLVKDHVSENTNA